MSCRSISPVGLACLIVWTGPASLLAAGPSNGGPPVPPAQAAAPPTELFRRLLSASPNERQKLLAGKPASSLLIISNALREYEALSPGLREVRLQTLELGWYLEPLLRVPASQRPERLAAVPAPWRGPIEQRLRLWDSLPAEVRQQVLASRSAVRVLLSAPITQPTSPPLPPGSSNPPGLPPIPRAGDTQRHRLHASLRLLFDLDAKEQRRILESFSEVQQAHMKKALEAFQALPPAQRDVCIAGLLKYSSLTPEQQQQFLKNCELWAGLSPQEQAALRRLVTLGQRLPPLPTGMPPVPPTDRPGASTGAPAPTAQ